MNERKLLFLWFSPIYHHISITVYSCNLPTIALGLNKITLPSVLSLNLHKHAAHFNAVTHRYTHILKHCCALILYITLIAFAMSLYICRVGNALIYALPNRLKSLHMLLSRVKPLHSCDVIVGIFVCMCICVHFLSVLLRRKWKCRRRLKIRLTYSTAKCLSRNKSNKKRRRRVHISHVL